MPSRMILWEKRDYIRKRTTLEPSFSGRWNYEWPSNYGLILNHTIVHWINYIQMPIKLHLIFLYILCGFLIWRSSSSDLHWNTDNYHGLVDCCPKELCGLTKEGITWSFHKNTLLRYSTCFTWRHHHHPYSSVDVFEKHVLEVLSHGILLLPCPLSPRFYLVNLFTVNVIIRSLMKIIFRSICIVWYKSGSVKDGTKDYLN
jgi:hypothetical protein